MLGSVWLCVFIHVLVVVVVDVGCWLLVIGWRLLLGVCRLLVGGCWLFVVGGWLLTVGCYCYCY